MLCVALYCRQGGSHSRVAGRCFGLYIHTLHVEVCGGWNSGTEQAKGGIKTSCEYRSTAVVLDGIGRSQQVRDILVAGLFAPFFFVRVIYCCLQVD